MTFFFFSKEKNTTPIFVIQLAVSREPSSGERRPQPDEATKGLQDQAYSCRRHQFRVIFFTSCGRYNVLLIARVLERFVNGQQSNDNIVLTVIMVSCIQPSKCPASPANMIRTGFEQCDTSRTQPQQSFQRAILFHRPRKARYWRWH